MSYEKMPYYPRCTKCSKWNETYKYFGKGECMGALNEKNCTEINEENKVMDFDKSKVYTALDADDLKVGSKIIVADDLSSLQARVAEAKDEKCKWIETLESVWGTSSKDRFKIVEGGSYNLAYLVSEPESNWIVYINRRYSWEPYLTSCRSDCWEKVQKDYNAKTKLFEGTETGCENWYEARKNFADIIAAWEDGKTIQFLAKMGDKDWEDLKNPAWEPMYEYRIKPEGLKWTDLKIGDILRRVDNDADVDMDAMVIAIDRNPATGFHVMVSNSWIADEYLARDWEKVEEEE